MDIQFEQLQDKNSMKHLNDEISHKEAICLPLILETG